MAAARQHKHSVLPAAAHHLAAACAAVDAVVVAAAEWHLLGLRMGPSLHPHTSQARSQRFCPYILNARQLHANVKEQAKGQTSALPCSQAAPVCCPFWPWGDRCCCCCPACWPCSSFLRLAGCSATSYSNTANTSEVRWLLLSTEVAAQVEALKLCHNCPAKYLEGQHLA